MLESRFATDVLYTCEVEAYNHLATWEPPVELNQAASWTVPVAAHYAGDCLCICRGLAAQSHRTAYLLPPLHGCG